MSGDLPRWEVEGRAWPHRAASQFHHRDGINWHVQIMGRGPTLVLLHGTGASTHSWRGLLPLLAERFTVVALDLPGHAFSSRTRFSAPSLSAMATLVGRLLESLRLRPAVVVGHSAGAAILAEMVLEGLIAPDVVVSINGALLPLDGLPGILFPVTARLITRSWLAPRLLSWRARQPGFVEELVENIGSTIDAEGLDCYRRLIGRPGHVAGVLDMLASWNLEVMPGRLRGLRPTTLFLVGERDRAVPPLQGQKLGAIVPRGEVVMMPGVGHLSHEERPAETAALIERVSAAVGVLRSPLEERA